MTGIVKEERVTKKKPRAPKPALGWREWLSLPELGVQAVKAKVDTGARSSSLHAEEIELFERKGVRWVAFDLEPSSAGMIHKGSQRVEMPLLDLRWITSSNGKRQKRPIIQTLIDIGGERWAIELSLGPRGTMGFPMLLGREAVRRRFLVDPGRSFLAKEHIPSRDVARRTKLK